MKMFVLMMLVVVFGWAGAARGQAARTALLQGVGIDQKLDAQVPLDLRFRDETGGMVRLEDLRRGKPVILVLVQYGCPSLCTVILNDSLSTLKVIPQAVGKEFDVWVVSFDPTETAALAMAKKESYLHSYMRVRPEAEQASAGWHFLTGDAASIAALTEAVGYRYRWDAATGQFVHPAALIVLTPEGRVARYFWRGLRSHGCAAVAGGGVAWDDRDGDGPDSAVLLSL